VGVPDDMVEDLTAATAHPSFRGAILPGRLDTDSFGFKTGCFQEGDDFKRGVAATAEEHADCRQDGADEFDHEKTFLTQRNVVPADWSGALASH
jgi:hypothetical protein